MFERDDSQKCITPACMNAGLRCLGGQCCECKAAADRFEQEHAAGFDPVTRPAHYEFASISPLNAVLDWNLNYLRGSALKYLVRAGRKGDEVEDLKKAAYCLRREIERVESLRASK